MLPWAGLERRRVTHGGETKRINHRRGRREEATGNTFALAHFTGLRPIIQPTPSRLHHLQSPPFPIQSLMTPCNTYKLQKRSVGSKRRLSKSRGTWLRQGWSRNEGVVRPPSCAAH